MQPITRLRSGPAALLVSVAVAATLLAPTSAGAERTPGHTPGLPPGSARSAPDLGSLAKIVRSKTIAPGLVFTRIVEKKIPRRTFVLRIDLRREITLDATLTRPRLPAHRTISEIVKRVGALAGVNGDFGRDRPTHPFAQDGQLLQTGDQLGALFAVARDESTTYFGKPSVAVSVTDLTSGHVSPLDRWNAGAPAPGEIAGFSPLGGTLELPPAAACSARLFPATAPIPASADGVTQDFTVDVVGCSAEPLARNGGVVLSAPPATDEATLLLALAPGTPMRLHWTLGWANVFDAVGGAPLILQDGQPTNQCNSACSRHPRTGVGVTATGRILLVVVDGRQPKWSLGPTMREFALIMRDLGAVTALNLDGGGSSTMVVNGDVVNRPSDGHERAVNSAIVILPGADPGEP